LTVVDDPFGRAVLLNRVSVARRDAALEAALPAALESAALFAALPASSERAQALGRCGLLLDQVGRHDEALHLMTQGLEIARHCGSPDHEASALVGLAMHDLLIGDPGRGLTRLATARELTADSTDMRTIVWVATQHTDALLRTGDLEEVHPVGIRALDSVRALGGASFRGTAVLASNIVEALLGLGDTERAGHLIDPITDSEPNVGDWPVHEMRVRVDVARGYLEAAQHRLDLVRDLTQSNVDYHIEITYTAAEVALWRGEPQATVALIGSLLPHVAETPHSRDTGALLVAGMRACADLAELAHARGDEQALSDARAAGIG
jgi:hypothetical protein